MSYIDAMAGIMLLIIFLFAVLLGVVLIVSCSSNREDRRRSLKGTPPDAASAGTRWLVGVARRETRNWPSVQSPHDAGHGRGQMVNQ